MTQIFPLRIHPLNPCNLLRPRPRLDLFLPTDCPLSAIEPLVVDKVVEPIPLTESRVGSVLVLPNSALHLPRHSGVERAVSLVGEKIDLVALSDDDHGPDSDAQVSSGSTQSHGSLPRSSSR